MAADAAGDPSRYRGDEREDDASMGDSRSLPGFGGRGFGGHGFGDEPRDVGNDRGFFEGDPDDGVVYGRPPRAVMGDVRADPASGRGPAPDSTVRAVVSEAILRREGGPAYLRSIEVLVTHRLRNLSRRYDADGILVLEATVRVADGFAADYRVRADIDENAGVVTDHHCTCPAAARGRGMCKHAIALVREYNDSPRGFAFTGGRPASAGSGTSVSLRGLLRAETQRRSREQEDRRRELLRVIGSGDGPSPDDGWTSSPVRVGSRRFASPPAVSASSGGAASGSSEDFRVQGGVRLRPRIGSTVGGWVLRLRVEASNGASYVVRDVADLLYAMRMRRRVEYGRRLAFVHEPRMFDERSRGVLALLQRGEAIRRGLTAGYAASAWHGGRGGVALSDEETCELLDLFVGSDVPVDYEPANIGPSGVVAVPVLDGDPDMGLSIVPDDASSPDVASSSVTSGAGVGGLAGKGLRIRHQRCIEEVISGTDRSFVLMRDAGYLPSTADWHARICRCSQRFIERRALVDALCPPEDAGDMTVAADDVPAFARAILPSLAPRRGDEAGVRSERSAEAGSPGSSGPSRGPESSSDRDADAPVLVVDAPEVLFGLRQETCRIEFYLDRDRRGVSCDLRARYGDRRFEVFDGPHPDDGVVRDESAERLAVQAVLRYFPRPEGPVARIPEDDDEAIHELVSRGVSVLRQVGEVFCTSAFDGLTPRRHPKIRLGLSVASGLVEISPIADDVDPEDVPGILKAIRERRRYHRLRDGSFVALADVDASSLDKASADLDLPLRDFEAGPVDVPLFQGFYLDSQAEKRDESEEFRAVIGALKDIDPATYAVPKTFSGVLRPYQAEGFRWLNALWDKGFGGVLADEMGLGKTVQLLALLEGRRDEARTIGPSLVVCPASLVYNWTAEAVRFAPDLRVAAVAGSKVERRALLENPEANDLLVTSYDLLRRDVDDYRGIPFASMTLDEAQAVKNRATKAARAVRAVDARHRFALTGTPIENRLAELWSLFDVLDPGMLGSYAHFRERFDRPVLAGDEDAQRRLQSLVGPFILRRRKSQVLDDLPDKTDTVITVQLEGAQRRLYAALEQRLRATILHDRQALSATGRIRVLAQLTRLRQVCCDPRLVVEEGSMEAVRRPVGRGEDASGALAGEQMPSAAAVDPAYGDLAYAGREGAHGVPKDGAAADGSRVGGSFVRMGGDSPENRTESAPSAEPAISGRGALSQEAPGRSVRRRSVSVKLDAIDDLVSSCRDEDRKMLIFSQFTSFLDLIAERLRDQGIAYDVITGSTPKRRRVELVDSFNADDTPVFLISLKAGNTGLNLTGASVVVHADPWWNAAAQEQADDRAHRIGQRHVVDVYRIVARDTIEERIIRLQQAKSDLASRFVDQASSDSASPLSSLTRENLLELLG